MLQVHQLPLTIALAGACACTTPAGMPQPRVAADGVVSAAPDEITVTVSALRNDLGTVRCFLYDDPDGFPDSAAHVIAKAVGLPAGGSAACHFRGVPRARDYAVSILHDENNDDVMQKGMFGIPKEGYGFSNDATARFSAPSFADCRFRFERGALALAITARYF